MAAPRIVWRYILIDVTQHTLLGLSVVTLVLLVQNVLRFIERLFGADVTPAQFVQLTAIILPSYLSYAIPTALLFGVLLSFARMSADGEIIALRSSGVSVYRMLPPVLLLGALFVGFTGYLAFEVEPRSQHRLKILVRQLTRSVSVIVPGRFRAFDSRTFFVRDHGDETCPLEGILIGDFADPKRPRYIAARCGAVDVAEESAEVILTLTDGSIHFPENETDSYRRIRFESGETRIDASDFLDPDRRARDHTFSELLELDAAFERGETPRLGRLDDHRDVRIQIHRRLAFPFASIALALLAVPLGIRPLRSGRSWGALMAIGVMTTYWGLLTIGEIVAGSGWLPVAIAMWLPDALVVTLALILLRRNPRIDA